MAIQIFVDSDSCPVKDEAIRVATRYSLQITLVSNQGMRPINANNVKQVVVGAQFDAADDWIVEHADIGDIAITADIQLAARCLDKGCKALNPSGHIFTTQNIGSALSMRELNAYLRETGDIKGHNPTFSKKDRSKFLQSIDMLIQKQ
ncbi:MAG: YaiI/YqxD family protein [Rickettsiales bacterium]|jgi:uncharacterized protein YaiI (UPF0178 family)